MHYFRSLSRWLVPTRENEERAFARPLLTFSYIFRIQRICLIDLNSCHSWWISIAIYCPVVWTARKAILNTGGMNKTFLYFTCDSGRLPSGQISRQGDTHNQDWAKAKGQSLEREKVTDINRHIIIEDILSWSWTSTSTLSTWRRNWFTTPPFHPTTRCINMPMICCWCISSHLGGVVAPPWCFAPLDRRGIMSRGPGDAFHPDLEREVPLGKAMPLCLHRIETNELEFFRHHVQWSKTEGMPKFQLQITMAQAFVAWVYISIVWFG